jgi:RNA polymerase sigma-70 factor, ECF subfamily
MVAEIFPSVPAPSPPPATGRASRAATAALATAHDAELVRRFNTGDDAAFVEIVLRHREKMFAVALALLGNHADAEEIAQDTFIRAHRGLAGFRGDSSLATWLHRITFNLSRNRYWYYHRRHRHETDSLDCALRDDSKATFADLVASDVPDPARAAAYREFVAHVAVGMGRLRAHQREILTLRNHRDHSYEEIAAILGVTVGTVKSRIARARDHLRRFLAETYVGVAPGTAPSGEWFEPNRSPGRLASACG